MDLLDDDDLLDLRRRGASTDPKAVIADERGRWRELPGSNADLTAFAGERQGGDACHLCDKRPRLTCRSCRRPACGSHSWVMLGVCRDCATEERMSRWHKHSEASDNWLEGA